MVRSGRLMGSDAISTLTKADNIAAIKCLEKMDSRHGCNCTILGSTLINVFFNICSKDQLIQLGSKRGLKLDP